MKVPAGNIFGFNIPSDCVPNRAGFSCACRTRRRCNRNRCYDEPETLRSSPKVRDNLLLVPWRCLPDRHCFGGDEMIRGLLSIPFGSNFFWSCDRRTRRAPRALAPVGTDTICAMGLSYTVMLIAFYMDNGKNLAVWRDLPSASYWLVPSAIGVPLILRAVIRYRAP